jgi:hypothetical protein
MTNLELDCADCERSSAAVVGIVVCSLVAGTVGFGMGVLLMLVVKLIGV